MDGARAHQFPDYNRRQRDVAVVLFAFSLCQVRSFRLDSGTSWPTCRLVVSQYWQRLDDFIRVFVSFVYATKDEMGFDPTVRRVKFQESICYVYQVNGRFFRTISPLFRGQVLCITGRMTRVWEAVEVGGTSEEEVRKEKNRGRRCVVKDVWLDKDSHTEGDNLSKIFTALDNVDVDHYTWDANINKTYGERLKNIITDILHSRQYNRYFMAIECDQRGKFTKERAQGADPDPKIFDKEPLTKKQKRTVSGSVQLTTSSSYSGGAGSIPLPAARLPPHDYKVKFQYRLVYKDVGKPLNKAPNLKSFSKGIHDACIGASCSCSTDGWWCSLSCSPYIDVAGKLGAP